MKHPAIQIILGKVSGSRFSIDRPCLIDGFTCATDGYRLLAVTGDFTDGQEPRDKFPVASCREWINATAEVTAVVSAADLMAFVGPIPSDKCTYCEGTYRKYIECERCDAGHDCVCEHCHEGIALKERLMLLGPAVINANLVSDVLAALKPDGAVSISVPSKDDRIVMRGSINGLGFVFIVMPMALYTHDATLPQLLQAVKP